ncbi:MAG: flagellar basal-body rod modification protein FlgD, partial [Alphaproteobacteria bacterium]|nr:flagellar basal-body rod modification protein FlgD [Alphaproteobacteria bacterium]
MAAATSLLPAITNSVAATAKSGATGASPASAGADTKTIAGNFNTFLTLLTTQLKNQNPLDPLDTNQFTQQLVQFAQVEQQMKQNDQLGTLISINKAAQSTNALAFVGATVVVDGQTAALAKGRAAWSLQVSKPVSATVTIRSATGQTVYSGSFTMSAGKQAFAWDGRDAGGVQWPDGNYTISVTGKDASGQTISIPSEIEGVVDSAD